MQSVPGGRHCTQCRQTVVDFTRMTDAALIAFVQQHPFGCGRYREDQVGRDLRIPDIKPSRSGIKWLMTLLLLFFGWMKEGMAQKAGSRSKAQRSPVTLTPVLPSSKTSDSDTRRTIPPKPAQDLANINTQVHQSNGTGLSVGGMHSISTEYVNNRPVLIREPMEPPGRRTIQGDDLPHSFRLEEENNSGN